MAANFSFERPVSCDTTLGSGMADIGREAHIIHRLERFGLEENSWKEVQETLN
jgi:hypothetical protein